MLAPSECKDLWNQKIGVLCESSGIPLLTRSRTRARLLGRLFDIVQWLPENNGKKTTFLQYYSVFDVSTKQIVELDTY